MYTKYMPRRRRRLRQDKRKRYYLLVFILGFILSQIASYLFRHYEIKLHLPLTVEKTELLSPIVKDDVTESAPRVAPTVVVKEPEPTPEPENYIMGKASYYSREGCIGCNDGLIMANGQELDDEALTLALTPEEVNTGKRLNDIVVVENVRNGRTVKAKVTDTGGFASYNRIADLSVATKQAIGCGDICTVKVVF